MDPLLLMTQFSRLIPLWGIVERPDGTLSCECGKSCQRPGKHPRRRNWKGLASADPQKLLEWIALYPHANFGALLNAGVIALDVDVRPEQGKHGLAELEQLEFALGKRLPDTVTVLSGRQNGSRHLFFRLPEGIRRDNLASPFQAIDLIANGYCVTPGSRHISGAHYDFDQGLSPLEQEVAPLPDFLIPTLAPKIPKMYLVSTSPLSSKPRPVNPAPESQKSQMLTVSPRRCPDWLVLRQLQRDKIAQPLFFAGERKYKKARGYDRSKDDFALACKLAFYTSHDWPQMHRLFQKSALYGEKAATWTGGGDYLTTTLQNAYEQTAGNWADRKKYRPSRATGAKRGRKLSANTEAVLELVSAAPQLPAVEISRRLGIRGATVRQILHRYRPPA